MAAQRRITGGDLDCSAGDGVRLGRDALVVIGVDDLPGRAGRRRGGGDGVGPISECANEVDRDVDSVGWDRWRTGGGAPAAPQLRLRAGERVVFDARAPVRVVAIDDLSHVK